MGDLPAPGEGLGPVWPPRPARRYRSEDLGAFVPLPHEGAPIDSAGSMESAQPWRSIRRTVSSADRPTGRRISFVMERMMSKERLEGTVEEKTEDRVRASTADAFEAFFKQGKVGAQLSPVEETAEGLSPAEGRAGGCAPQGEGTKEGGKEAFGDEAQGAAQRDVWQRDLWDLQSHLQTSLSRLVARKEKTLACVRREAAEEARDPRALAPSASLSRIGGKGKGGAENGPAGGGGIKRAETAPAVAYRGILCSKGMRRRKKESPGPRVCDNPCVPSAADVAKGNAGGGKTWHKPEIAFHPLAEFVDLSPESEEACDEGPVFVSDTYTSSESDDEFPENYDPVANGKMGDVHAVMRELLGEAGRKVDEPMVTQGQEEHVVPGSMQKLKPDLKLLTSLPQGHWDTQGWTPDEAPEEPTSFEERCFLTIPSIESDELLKVSEIGRGQTGSVYLCQWKGVPVAMKEWHDLRDESNEKMMMREAETLAALRHPCVISLYGTVEDSASPAHVVEFMRGRSLKSKLQEMPREVLTRQLKASIALQACRGMEFLHSRSIIHFDLKCENLLCDLRDTEMPDIKIGDMGLSKRKLESFVSGNMRGTLPWMAPELLPSLDGQPSGKVNEKIDVYSFGVCLWEIWNHGAEPYPGLDSAQLMYGLMSDTLQLDMSYNPDPDWVSLITSCMNREPALRPSFSDIAWKLDSLLRRWSCADNGLAPIATVTTWASSNWANDLPMI